MSFDVKTAFLHARLPYSIYVKQIPGYPEENPKTVLKLLVALYGLKQSAYKWYKLLSNTFRSLGLLCCEADHAVFIERWTTPPPSVYPLIILQSTTYPHNTHSCRRRPGNLQLTSTVPMVHDGNVQKN